MRILAAICAALMALLGAAHAQSLEQLYQRGELNAARRLLDTTAPQSDSERLVACRLALYGNRLDEARVCTAALRAANPDDRTALALSAETSWRSGDYAAAADARRALGDAIGADRLQSFVSAPPYQLRRGARPSRVRLERADPLPVVRARVGDGPPRYFIIDTGAGDTVLSPTLIEEGGVRVFGETEGLFGGGSTAQAGRGVASSLRLGDVIVRNIPVTLLDTSAYNQAAPGLEIRGVIGVGVLSQFISTLDFPNNELVLRWRPTRWRSGDVLAPMWLFGDHFIVVESFVNDRPYAAFVDTGLSGMSCTAPRSTVDALGIIAGELTEGGVNGAGQTMSVSPFTATLAIGDARQQEARCLLGPFPQQIETLGGMRLGVLISHAFFRPYAVTFDFQNMRLVMSSPR